VTTQVDIYNLALTMLDTSQAVQSVNDGSEAAGSCNRFYTFARQRVLERCFWDFATKTAALALLLDQSTLSNQSQLVFPGWRYIYTQPTDCVRPLAVTTQYGMRLNPYTRSWWYDMSQAPQWGPYRPPWRRAIDQVNTASPAQSIDILTDQDSAWLVYVMDVTNVNLWSQAFCECVAWNLAAKIAGPVSANQVAKSKATEMADKSIASAMMIELNSQQPDPYPDSPGITARN
jgi:hypothetical protein